MDVLVEQTLIVEEELGTLIAPSSNLYVLDVLYSEGSSDRLLYQVLENGKRIVRDDLEEPEDCELPAHIVEQIRKRTRHIAELRPGYMHGFAPQR